MAEQDDSTLDPPLPENVIDIADVTVCSYCGETYDASWADLSFFHNSNHTITEAPHVRGERFDAPPETPPPPIPGCCNVVSFTGKRCVVPLGEHERDGGGALMHRAGDSIFVITAMTEEPGPNLHLVDLTNDDA
jgi:hypothetical protein